MKWKTAVLGSGSWGTSLAVHLANKGIPVTLWTRSALVAENLQLSRENKKYLPGIKLNNEIIITNLLPEALENAKYVILATPSQTIREIAILIRSHLSEKALIISTAKGLEQGTKLRMTEVLEAELTKQRDRIAVLSGPSHAEEVARQLPTAVVIASHNDEVAREAQDLFMSPSFRVYTNPDVIGVELGGALKNIIALATGMADGLGFGDNTRAALMTRGASEISRLGKKMGAELLTFAGLAGIGDLIVTCSSMHSRNRRAGIALGKGMAIKEVLASMGMVIEGITTTKTAFELATQLKIPMPIVTEMYQILFQGKDPLSSVDNLMDRNKTSELGEMAIDI